MPRLTDERLAELRRVAEAATPGPWRIPGANVFRVVAPETQNQGDPYYRWAVIADADPRSVDGEQAAANACYIATFDPPTVLAMLDEIERLRRELAELEVEFQDQNRKLGEVIVKNENLRQERETLADLLRQVDVVMDGAAMDGVKSILAPQYQDDWALVHTRVREQIALIDAEKGGGGE